MSHAIERAPTGRAKCRACGRPIARGTLRLGERLPNPFDEKGGEMTHWFHLPCAAFRRPEPLIEALGTATDPIDERDTLEREAHLGVTHRRLPRVNTVERAPSGRAACRACRAPIEKGAWRISLLYYEDGRFVPSGFIHLACAAGYLETTAILPRLRHFTPAVSADDVLEIEAALGAAPNG
jgi:hypothetical protein